MCQLASRIQFSQYADERPLVESVTIRRNQEFSLGLFLKMRQDDGRLEITGTKDGADAIGKNILALFELECNMNVEFFDSKPNEIFLV